MKHKQDTVVQWSNVPCIRQGDGGFKYCRSQILFQTRLKTIIIPATCFKTCGAGSFLWGVGKLCNVPLVPRLCKLTGGTLRRHTPVNIQTDTQTDRYKERLTKILRKNIKIKILAGKKRDKNKC